MIIHKIVFGPPLGHVVSCHAMYNKGYSEGSTKRNDDDEFPMTAVDIRVGAITSTRRMNGVYILIGPPFQLLSVRMNS